MQKLTDAGLAKHNIFSLLWGIELPLFCFLVTHFPTGTKFWDKLSRFPCNPSASFFLAEFDSFRGAVGGFVLLLSSSYSLPPKPLSITGFKPSPT